MLRLTSNARCSDKKIEQLRDKTRELLSGHNPVPSLVHGDLWGKRFFSLGPRPSVTLALLQKLPSSPFFK